MTMEIVDGIEKYMQAQGFDSVADMVGIVKIISQIHSKDLL